MTTNLMGTYLGLDYWKLAPHLDVVSWDNYPCWHGGGTIPDARGALGSRGEGLAPGARTSASCTT